MTRGVEYDDHRARRPTRRRGRLDLQTGARLPEDVGAVRRPDLLFHRVGRGRRPHHSDGGGLQTHLRDEHLPGLAGPVGVLRCVLPAGNSRRAHQPEVRIQGRSSLRCPACCRGRHRLLPGKQDHDVRSVPRRLVRDRGRMLDPGNVRQSLCHVTGSGGDRDSATQFRPGIQSGRHQHRGVPGRHPDSAQAGRADEHGQPGPGPGAGDPGRPAGGGDGPLPRARIRLDRHRSGDRDQEVATDRRRVRVRRPRRPATDQDPVVQQALQVSAW